MSDAFEKAVEESKILKTRPNYTDLGLLYGLYKQGMVGDVNIDRPGLLDVPGRAKWKEWNANKGMLREDAKAAYVVLVEELKEKYGF